jgi:hypothetical protein
VLSCVDEDGGTQKMHTALAELCKTYWRPVFAFIRRLGHSPPDAQDLMRDFFVILLKGQLLQRADPARGRFRSLVLKALEDFYAIVSRETGRIQFDAQLFDTRTNARIWTER